MSVAVYVPLLLSLLAAAQAQRVAGRLEPATATWLLTTSAVALATVSTIALAALAATIIGQAPLLAAHGHWSAQAIHRHDPAWPPIAVIACALLSAALATACRATARHLRALASAARTSRSLAAHGRIAIVDDQAPRACAIPGRPGHIMVSTGMLAALDDHEQQVLIAHEDAHLAKRHYLFVTLTHVAAAANPLLRPLATAVQYTTERWADEHAARHAGDRRLTARTIGKAALLTRAARSDLPALPAAAGSLHRTGPIPRRVAALLAPPPSRTPLLLIGALTVIAIAGITTLEAARDIHVLFSLATQAPHK